MSCVTLHRAQISSHLTAFSTSCECFVCSRSIIHCCHHSRLRCCDQHVLAWLELTKFHFIRNLKKKMCLMYEKQREKSAHCLIDFNVPWLMRCWHLVLIMSDMSSLTFQNRENRFQLAQFPGRLSKQSILQSIAIYIHLGLFPSKWVIRDMERDRKNGGRDAKKCLQN